MGMLLFVAFLFNCLKRWTFLDGFTKVHLLLHLCKCNVLCKAYGDDSLGQGEKLCPVFL